MTFDLHNAIKCSSTDDVVNNLQKLKVLPAKVELDAALGTASSEICNRFGK